jgi:hypothetical protein
MVVCSVAWCCCTMMIPRLWLEGADTRWRGKQGGEEEKGGAVAAKCGVTSERDWGSGESGCTLGGAARAARVATAGGRRSRAARRVGVVAESAAEGAKGRKGAVVLRHCLALMLKNWCTLLVLRGEGEKEVGRQQGVSVSVGVGVGVGVAPSGRRCAEGQRVR